MKLRGNKRVWAGIAAAMSTLGLAAMALPATADPAGVTAYQGVGSDTTQAIMNAHAGAEPYPDWTEASPPNIFYTPIKSSVATGQRILSSWNAIPQNAPAGDCITTKAGGPAFERPNGSSAGINALLAAINGTGWVGTATCTPAPGKIISGNIDYARSSRGPTSTGSTLTFIPFGRDAVSYAIYKEGTVDAGVNTLSTAQLTSLYTNGTITVGSTLVKACAIQSGSGTLTFFAGAVGRTPAQVQAAAVTAGCGTAGNHLQEHDGDAFLARANPIVGPGEAAVVGFSVANWVAQANLVSQDRSNAARAAGVDLGDVDNRASGAKPYNGTAPNLSADSAFYTFNSGGTVGTYGRDVYNVVDTNRIDAVFGDAPLISLMVGNTSSLCTAPALARTALFGYLNIANCGSTSLTGNT